MSELQSVFRHFTHHTSLITHHFHAMSSPHDLLLYVFGRVAHPLAVQLAEWVNTSARFRAFLDIYRDKVRKKVRVAQSSDELNDLRAELAVAYLLLQDRRCVVEYEKLGVRQQRAPDFTVIFKTHTPFNVEVTRLRSTTQEEKEGAGDGSYKLVNTLCDKLGQLPPSVMNLLALVTEQNVYTPDQVHRVFELLRERAIQKDENFFFRRGLEGVRHFHRQQQRLSAVLLCPRNDQNQRLPPSLWLNPQAKHPLPPELKNLLRALV
jgi:hypothetical protein